MAQPARNRPSTGLHCNDLILSTFFLNQINDLHHGMGFSEELSSQLGLWVPHVEKVLAASCSGSHRRAGPTTDALAHGVTEGVAS